MQKQVDQEIRARFLKDLWLWSCGQETPARFVKTNPLQTLWQSQWDYDFEKALRNRLPDMDLTYIFNAMRVRLVQGTFRYGGIGNAHKPAYDHIGRIFTELRLWQQDRNPERLIDCLNMCLLHVQEKPAEEFERTVALAASLCCDLPKDFKRVEKSEDGHENIFSKTAIRT